MTKWHQPLSASQPQQKQTHLEVWLPRLVPAWQGVSHQNHTQFTLPATPRMLRDQCQLFVSLATIALHRSRTRMFAEMSASLTLDRSVPRLSFFSFSSSGSAPGKKGNEDNPSVVRGFESTVKGNKIKTWTLFLLCWGVLTCPLYPPPGLCLFGGCNSYVFWQSPTLRCCSMNHQE